MPMIDVYAAAGTFRDTHALAQELAAALMAVERVPDIPMFRKNTAAFVHELPGVAPVERRRRQHQRAGPGPHQPRGARSR